MRSGMEELIETPACSYYRKPEPRRPRRGAPFQPELQTRDGAFPPVVASIGKNTAEGGYYPRLMTLVRSVPIPGTTKRHQLDENVGAASVQLTTDDLRDIDREASR